MYEHSKLCTDNFRFQVEKLTGLINLYPNTLLLIIKRLLILYHTS